MRCESIENLLSYEDKLYLSCLEMNERFYEVKMNEYVM